MKSCKNEICYVKFLKNKRYEIEVSSKICYLRFECNNGFLDGRFKLIGEFNKYARYSNGIEIEYGIDSVLPTGPEEEVWL